MFEDNEHPEQAPIIGEKVIYCAIINECKKLYCKNGTLKNERVCKECINIKTLFSNVQNVSSLPGFICFP